MSSGDRRLYKYIREASLSKSLEHPEFVSLKCSTPREYNDPYELFLTISFDNAEPEMLAFYNDLVGELPELPTTCFSRAPDVVPMWAHYAEDHTGAVVEFDENLLLEHFAGARVGDVEYRDEPDPGLGGALEFAYGTQKFRHSYSVAQSIFNAAYYTKTTAWSYERERRLVSKDEHLSNRGGLRLLDVPKECVTAFITGCRAKPATKSLLQTRAQQMGSAYYEMRIGRLTAAPYFVAPDDQPYRYTSEGLVPSPNYCLTCREPKESSDEECNWCRIGDEERSVAASNNPMRLLDRYGLLDEYISGSGADSA